MVHACEMANQEEKYIAIRRASGFNELYKAALKQECQTESDARANHGPKKGKGKEKQRFGPEVQNLLQLTKDLIKEPEARKWTWEENLTDKDLCELVRDRNRAYQIPHSGYNADLPTGSLISNDSKELV